ncbi:S-layer homology domain-containing protein [Paenibacillus puldeungensis]|uniref:S-layer homology domain-containing protein n=1 Tax=Paenibacillus puldeungensis TaxID=696536 RepID=A0ABW3RRJ2_9BACL
MSRSRSRGKLRFLSLSLAVILAIMSLPFGIHQAKAEPATTNIPVGGHPRAVAVNPVTNKIYVVIQGDQGKVAVLDGADNTTTMVDVGASPVDIAINVRTNKICVVNQGSNNVTVIDGTDNKTETVQVGENPVAVAINSITDKIYVANSISNNITVISGTNHSTETVSAGIQPFALAVNPLTDTIYAVNSGSDNVTVINGINNTTSTVKVGSFPLGVAVNSATNKIYVADLGETNVTVIDGNSNLTQTIDIGVSPYGLKSNPTTNKIYVSHFYDNDFTVINQDGSHSDISMGHTNLPGSVPPSLTVNPMTNRVYGTNLATGEIAVIDGISNTATNINAGGKTPSAIGVNPITKKVYVANYESQNVTVFQDTAPSTVPPLITQPSILPEGTRGTSYNGGAMNASGGVPPYNWSATGLPEGLGVNPVTGEVYGTPTTPGIFNVDFTVEDGTGMIAIMKLPITINQANAAAPFIEVFGPQGPGIYTKHPSIDLKFSESVTPVAGGKINVTVSGAVYSADVLSSSQQVSDNPFINFRDFKDSSGNELVLDYGKQYHVNVPYGVFKDADGNGTPEISWTFFTPANPDSPTLYPYGLKLVKGKEASFTIFLGQGSSGATSAQISSIDQGKIVSITPTTLNSTEGTAGLIKVTGLSEGMTNINVFFGGPGKPIITFPVTVEVISPIWPIGSSMTAASISSAEVTLHWTEALDPTGVTGYKLFRNGVEVAVVPGNVNSYKVTGLSSATAYTFQVQAVNTAGGWTTNGPSALVTTLPSVSPGGNPGGNSSDNNSAGGSTNTPASSGTAVTPAVPSTVTLGAGESKQALNAKIDTRKGVATAILEADALNKVFDKAEADSHGLKKIQVQMPKVQGANTYALEVPAAALAGENLNRRIEFTSDLGGITLPGNMLKDTKLDSAENVGISMEKADMSKLPQDVQNAVGSRPAIKLKLTAGQKTMEWNNPDAQVTISIPYTPTAKELADPDHIVAGYIDGDGHWNTIPSGRYDAKTGKLTFSTTHLGLYAVGYQNKTFDDLLSVAWAKDDIEVLASKGILRGVSDTEYAPKSHITRADFLFSLIKALGIDAKIDSNFEDIGNNAYYYREIAIAKKLGIATGDGSNQFNPDESISRQDMMVLTAKALMKLDKLGQKNLATSNLEHFADKSLVAGYAVDSVASLVKEGLINGDKDKLNPQGLTTRAEAAVFLHRIYNML